MRWYKRLRWRLVGLQFLMAFVGVTIVLIGSQLIFVSRAPFAIRPTLSHLLQSPAALDQAENAITAEFRTVILMAVSVAAVGALLVGVISSLFIWRTLVYPLRQIANASQRVADGRYSERIPVPDNGGEALTQVITNFNAMAAVLEQIEQQRVALIANVSHELRTPLTAIQGYIEGMQDGVFGQTAESYGVIGAELERLRRLVQDLQDLSRVEAGQIALHMQLFDLQPLVEAALFQLRPQLHAKQITLVFEPAPTPFPVRADHDRVTQILINLLSNALRYTPNHGQIMVTLQTLGRATQITIHDTGIGIPAAELPYVFERFYRVDGSRSRDSGGSGVGLTIARHLAWAMGGELTAASAGPDAGSTFTLTLLTAPALS